MFIEWMRGKIDIHLLSVMGASLARCLDRLTSSETELRLFFQYCDLPPLITVEDRQNLSSEILAWPAVSSLTAEINVHQWLPLLQDFLQ